MMLYRGVVHAYVGLPGVSDNRDFFFFFCSICFVIRVCFYPLVVLVLVLPMLMEWMIVLG